MTSMMHSLTADFEQPQYIASCLKCHGNESFVLLGSAALIMHALTAYMQILYPLNVTSNEQHAKRSERQSRMQQLSTLQTSASEQMDVSS